MLDSVVKVKKKHCPQTFLEESKYEPKKIKMENLIDHDLEKSSSNELDNEADDDSNDETESDDDNDESNLMMIMMNPMNNSLKAKKVF